jgi:hypothetical protein
VLLKLLYALVKPKDLEIVPKLFNLIVEELDVKEEEKIIVDKLDKLIDLVTFLPPTFL